jgi:hypothetical protein
MEDEDGLWLVIPSVQEKTKQNTKTCMFRDNRSNVHYCYWCCGGTYWPRSTGSDDSKSVAHCL